MAEVIWTEKALADLNDIADNCFAVNVGLYKLSATNSATTY